MKYELVEVNKHFELQKGISYTSKELADESETGLLTINAFNAGGGFKLESEKPFCGELKPEFLLSDGDVLLAMTEQDAGLLASPLTIKSDYSRFSNLTFSLDVARVLSTSGQIEPRFLYNVLRIPAFRVRAAYGDTGSTVQRLPYEAFGELKIPRPPLNVQKAIVQIIDDIDSKVYSNNQTSKSLEQIAQTIFKSWFVDFDPVHAKSRGEHPEGMDDETAVLFPDSCEESELGLIPSGWVPGPLSQNFDIISGGTPRTNRDDYWNGEIPWYSVGDLPEGNAFFVKTSKTITRLGADNSAVNVLKANSTIISARGTVGKVVMNGVASAFNQSCYGLQGVEPFFTFCLTKQSVPKLLSITHGGTFDTITRSSFDSISVPLVTEGLKLKFEQIVTPVFDQVRNLVLQNEALSALRDSLLPRLISGELDIPEELLVD